MHIFISGATGRNGRLILAEALARNHTVTVLARDPSSLTPHPNLTIIKEPNLNTMEAKDIKANLVHYRNPNFPPRRPNRPLNTNTPSAILTTLNQRRVSDNPFSPLSPDTPPDLLTSTAQILLSAIANTTFNGHPPKIIVNSLFGARDSMNNMSWLFRAVLNHSTMKIAIKDHNNMDELIRKSGVPFVFARAARLTEGPAETVRVWPDDGQGCGWNAVISRASLAEWMVKAAEATEWDGRSPVLTK